METKTYTTIDRAALKWPSGPWDGEPDKMQWQDEVTGLPCLAKRHPISGHWCGYVGVPPSHPLFGKDYSDVDLEGHGGVNFSDACDERPEAEGICHVPGEGEPDRAWWFGFDCAHAWDASPADFQRARDEPNSIWKVCHDQSYKTLAYVRGECQSLAAQLKAVS
jgi:hypothetical protein